METLRRVLWVSLPLLALLLVACGETEKPPSIEPAEVEPIPDTDLALVRLTAEAATRINLMTTPVLEQEVSRRRRIGGVVEAFPEGAFGDDIMLLWVRVPLSASDLSQIKTGEAARVFSLTGADDAAGVLAEAVDAPSDSDTETTGMALYYLLDADDATFAPGERVLAEITLLGDGSTRKVVPYGAVIYGLNGENWTYTSPEPLTFVRHSISVDFIDNDSVVLLDGPPVGTEVVTVGAAELFGTEFGVGK